jgi:hypothetical protein
LRSIDRFLKLEAALFLSSIGDQAELRLNEAILACLPAVGNDFEIDRSLQKLDELGKGKLLQFCGVALKSTFTIVRGYVQALADSRAPIFKGATDTPFLKNVKKALARFAFVTLPAASDGLLSTLYGVDALNHMYITIEPKAVAVDTTNLRYDDFKTFHMFKWLVTNDKMKNINTWTDRLYKTSAVPLALAEPVKKRGRKTEPTSAADIIADLYKD